MINKIGNWVFGSFFRTIGRLLVFVLLGVIISHLVDFGSLIDNFRITDLFFEKVNAAEYVDGFDTTYYSDAGLQNRYSSNGWYDYTTAHTVNSQNGAFTETWFYLNPLMNITDIRTGEITIPIYVSTPVVSTTTQSEVPGMDYCDRWIWGTIDSYNNVIRWDCSHINQTDNYTITDREYLTPQLTISAFVQYDTGYIDICNVDMSSNKITCPIASYTTLTSVKGIQIQSRLFYSTSSNQYTYYIGMFRKINRYGNSTQAIIDNQNQNTQQQIQQQQQQHNEIMDSNTTQAEDEASDFLGNFTVSDTGGLNAIITAPLSTIQSLLNNTCTNLVLPLPFINQNLTLPCLYPIYNDYFGAFFTIYQTIILGIVSYRCLKSLFFDIKGFTNPEDDRIEVMDL